MTICTKKTTKRFYDSFFDDGYSSNEAWDTLVWYLDVEIDERVDLVL